MDRNLNFLLIKIFLSDPRDETIIIEAVKKARESPALIVTYVDDIYTTRARDIPIRVLTIEALRPLAMSTSKRCWRIVLMRIKNLFC